MREALIREIQELRLLVGSSRDPEGRVFAQLGDALRRYGEYSEAMAVLREGVEQHPHFTPGYVALGWAAQESGRLDEALDGYRRVLELDPENPFGLFGAGALLQARGDASGARMMGRAVELHPGVGMAAPEPPSAAGTTEELPFISLAELAPHEAVTGSGDGAASGADLPFMTLAELAPAGSREALAGDLPFVPLSDLAPSSWTSELSAVEAPAGPETSSDAPVEIPFLSLAELAPVEGVDLEAAPYLPDDESATEDEPPEPLDATPVTRTMAELFVRQGLVDRAIQLYEQLLERRPGDEAAEQRLRELRTGGVGTEADDLLVVGAGEEGRESPDASHHPAMSVPEPEPLAPSPYGWTGEGEESAEPPPEHSSAAAYFGRLLAWTPGNPARESDEAGGSQPAGDPSAGDA